MARTTADGVEGVQALVGEHLGFSDWVEITQEQVDRFAGATLDSATPVDGGLQMAVTVTVEVEGGSKPAMVATTLSRRYV